MSFKTNLTIAALGLMAICGCKKKEEAPKEDTKAAAAAAPAVTEKSPEQKLEEEVEELATQIDMPEDFIAAAEEEINDENLEAELAKLEKEVEAEVKAAGITLPDPSSKKAPTPPGVLKPPTPVNKAPAPDVHH